MPQSQAGFTLGFELKDISTGFVGFAMSRSEFISGTVQYCLQSPVKPGKENVITAECDIQVLDVVSEGISDRVTPITELTPIPLGSKVKCKVTGFEGFAAIRCISFNGCVQYVVQPSCTKKDNKIPSAEFFDYKLLEIIGEGASKTVKPESGGCSPGTLRKPNKHKALG